MKNLLQFSLLSTEFGLLVYVIWSSLQRQRERQKSIACMFSMITFEFFYIEFDSWEQS